MSAYRQELDRRLQEWRTANQTRGCPRDVRARIAAEVRAQVGPIRTGLAALSPERRAEISAMGGKAAHARGTAYAFTPEKAKEAGAKGGATAHERGVAHRFTPEEAREAGKKGGVGRGDA